MEIFYFFYFFFFGGGGEGSRQVSTAYIDETRSCRKMAEDLCQFPQSDTLQDVITEVWKSQPSTEDRKVKAIIN